MKCPRIVQGSLLPSIVRGSSVQTTKLNSHRAISRLSTVGHQHPRQPVNSIFAQSNFIHHSQVPHRRGYATAATTPQILVNDLRNGHQEILVGFNENHTVRYPSFWLRDHCTCNACAHPHTKQRQINTFDINPTIQAVEAAATPSGLDVKWSQDKHRSHYPWEWLANHVPFSAAPTTQHPRAAWEHVKPNSAEKVAVDFSSVMKDDIGIREFVNNIRSYGYSFVSNVPETPEATESLLQRISFIRPTQYGGFWDFTSEVKPVDTAYTNLSLPLHTDTTYFTDPAGLQLFHCLQIATGGGGQSTFSDAFAAATQLYNENPDFYNILSSVRIVSHASGSSEKFGTFVNNAAHATGFPVFTHSTPHIRPHPKHLTQVRWNNDDRHSATQWPSHERMIVWYRAARRWQELLASPEFQWEVQLKPGMPIIFDNWRVVHGRRASEGKRRICGGYIGMDEFLARWRAVNAEGQRQQPGNDTQEESENEEKIKQEQEEEKREEKLTDEDVEPDVLPQKEEGVDRPIAS